MKNVLVVSENEYLNSIYVINLEVYLAVGVVRVPSIDDAILALKANKKFDLIISQELMGEENALLALEKHLKAYALKIPIIVTGAAVEGNFATNIYGVSSKFNIQGILKTGANILGITAKQMAELDIGDFYPISLEPLFNFKTLPCPIFLRDEEKYKNVIKADEPVGDKLIALFKNGEMQVYVNSGDRLTIINKLSSLLIEKMTAALKNIAEDASIATKIKGVGDGFEFAASNLFTGDTVKQQLQEIALASCTVMKSIVKDAPNLKTLMASMLDNKNGYIYTHSMIVSYVYNYMVKNTDQGGDEQIDKMNFIIFFHDIFLAQLYLSHPEFKGEADLLKNKKLDEKKKFTIMNHANLGAELVTAFPNCPKDASKYIREHHGIKAGKGFAAVYEDDLSLTTKFFIIAEIFVEEFMKANDQGAPFNKVLLTLKLSKQFSYSPTFSKIVQTLANVPL